MRYIAIFFLLAGSLVSVSCSTQHDPMEKYEELGVPKGFTQDTYKRDMMKSTKKKSGFSFFSSHYEEEQEKRRRFRDVSRPMEPGTVSVFPWGDNRPRRSEELHDEIRRDSTHHRSPLF